MRNKTTLLVLAFTLSIQAFLFGQNQITLDSTVLRVDTVITGLNVPWEMQWGPDGWIWMTERYGIVSRVNPADGTKQELLDLRDEVRQSGESGLLGMALHPDFSDSAFIYLVYTYDDGDFNERMVRYEYSGGALVHPSVLIDKIPANTTHDGSRLLILPDYTILMTTGDAQNQNAAQDTTSLNGKVLRLNLDGSIPADNPIEGSPVWSWGHRNAQGMTLAPDNIIYSSEHGPNSDDEINILEKGRNYGWPEVEGFCNTMEEMNFCNAKNVTAPIYAWTPTIATSDIIWYAHEAIPEFQNTLLLSTLKEQMIVKLTFNESGNEVIETTEYFSNRWGRLRDILQGPEGEIYLATNGASWSNTDPGTHSIIRLSKAPQPTSVVNNSWHKTIFLYPNPASQKVTLTIPADNIKVESLAILDVSGKKLKTVNIKSFAQRTSIDISHLSPGVYHILIETNQGNAVKKVLKSQ